MSKRINLLLIVLSLLLVPLLAQDSPKVKKLKNKRSNIENKIKVAEATLKSTNTQKQSSIGKLNAIRQLILARNAYIASLNQEIEYLTNETAELNEVIGAMQNDLDSLRLDYGEMVYQASKINNNINKLTLLLTSKSYNELSARLKIMNQYAESRRSQVRKIDQVKESLIERNKQLQLKKKEKEGAKVKIKDEQSKLQGLKKQQDDVIKDLKGKEDDIRKQLKKLQKQQKELNDLIQREIQKQIDEQDKSPTKYRDTEEDKLAGKEFEVNKGRLPWPLTKCFISGKFGKQPHAHLDGVDIENKGLKLQAPTSGAVVRSCFAGEVVAVASIPGVGKVVMIKHGTYYTVYSGLKTSIVTKGANVTAKQNLGTLKQNLDGAYELDFQVWKGRAPQNPVYWLYKAR